MSSVILNHKAISFAELAKNTWRSFISSETYIRFYYKVI